MCFFGSLTILVASTRLWGCALVTATLSNGVCVCVRVMDLARMSTGGLPLSKSRLADSTSRCFSHRFAWQCTWPGVVKREGVLP
eukprot:1634249-Amphidinium_carterae.1